MLRKTSISIVLAAGVSACASSGEGYPSLEIRDVERAQGQLEPVPGDPISVPPVPVTIEGTLAEHLASLRARASEAHREFLDAASRASGLAEAASGSAVGSDAWADAQVALANLDSIRSRTAIPLADLDILHVAAAVQAEERAAIEATRSEVIALVAAEDAVLARLREQVRP